MSRELSDRRLMEYFPDIGQRKTLATIGGVFNERRTTHLSVSLSKNHLLVYTRLAYVNTVNTSTMLSVRFATRKEAFSDTTPVLMAEDFVLVRVRLCRCPEVHRSPLICAGSTTSLIRRHRHGGDKKYHLRSSD